MPVQIIKRSKAKSAVGAAAYRSGTKMTNEWDGLTHDYTRKRGVVHSEIILPPHAPPEFQDRNTLWNSVEMVEKTSDAQLAREIEIPLPVELNREEQLQLARSFISDTWTYVNTLDKKSRKIMLLFLVPHPPFAVVSNNQ